MADLMIDLDKLENLVTTVDGWQAQCPLCNFNGEDQKNRNHLGIQRDGKFNCLKYSADPTHLKAILDLVGVNSDGILKHQYIVPEPKLSIPESWPLNILKGLIKNYDYWQKRGVSSTTCEKFHVGVATKGMLKNRSVVPIFDESRTKIIGFNGRKLNEDQFGPKWKILGEKKQFLFGGELFSIEQSKTVIITEGPADILYLSEHGINNTLCLFGVEISSKLLSYLIRINPNRILISTNNEVENFSIGNKAAEKIRNKLLQFFNEDKIEIALPTLKDFNLMNFNEIAMWREKFKI